MARDRDLTEARNKAIKEAFEKLRAKRGARNRRLHSVEHILYLLSQQYYLSERTLERIIYGDTGKPDKGKQAMAA